MMQTSKVPSGRVVSPLWRKGIDMVPCSGSELTATKQIIYTPPLCQIVDTLASQGSAYTSSPLPTNCDSDSDEQCAPRPRKGEKTERREQTELEEWTARLEEELLAFNAFDEQLKQDLGLFSARRSQVNHPEPKPCLDCEYFKVTT